MLSKLFGCLALGSGLIVAGAHYSGVAPLGEGWRGGEATTAAATWHGVRLLKDQAWRPPDGSVPVAGSADYRDSGEPFEPESDLGSAELTSDALEDLARCREEP